MLKSPIPKKKYYGVKVTEFKKLNKIYLPFFKRKDKGTFKNREKLKIII